MKKLSFVKSKLFVVFSLAIGLQSVVPVQAMGPVAATSTLYQLNKAKNNFLAALHSRKTKAAVGMALFALVSLIAVEATKRGRQVAREEWNDIKSSVVADGKGMEATTAYPEPEMVQNPIEQAINDPYGNVQVLINAMKERIQSDSENKLTAQFIRVLSDYPIMQNKKNRTVFAEFLFNPAWSGRMIRPYDFAALKARDDFRSVLFEGEYEAP